MSRDLLFAVAVTLGVLAVVGFGAFGFYVLWREERDLPYRHARQMTALGRCVSRCSPPQEGEQ